MTVGLWSVFHFSLCNSMTTTFFFRLKFVQCSKIKLIRYIYVVLRFLSGVLFYFFSGFCLFLMQKVWITFQINLYIGKELNVVSCIRMWSGMETFASCLLAVVKTEPEASIWASVLPPS